MADYYVDHGAYTSALGTTPTWGVPQEGDGTSKDAATSSAVASISFSSVPTTGTISVCGASVSTTGVISAASADAAANALAANINATTGAVSTTFANATTTNANQLRNVAFARGPSGGAPAGTCQIMMRGGSASHNTTGIASTLDGSPTLSQFSGGSGGCWGWFINPSAMGVSSTIAAFQYGLFLYIPLFGTTPGGTDTVWVRTGGGASKAITLTWTTAQNIAHAAYSKNLVFDTNTKWTTDSAVGALKIIFSAKNWGINHSFTLAVGNMKASYHALRLGGFELEYQCSQTQGLMNIAMGSPSTGYSFLHCKNVVFRDSMAAASIGHGLWFGHGYSSVIGRFFEGCKVVVTTPRASICRPLAEYGAYQSSFIEISYIGCEFDFNISGVSDPGQLISYGGQPSDTKFVFKNCKFSGFAGGYTLHSTPGAAATNSSRLNITVDNCSGLKMPATYLGLPVSSNFVEQAAHQITMSSAGLNQGALRVENCRGVAEWLPDDPTPFPYLSASLPGSGTPYSLRLAWVRAVPLSKGSTYESPSLRMFTQLAAAARTITVQVFVPSDVSENIALGVGYIDSTGVAQRCDVSVVQSSGVTWANSPSYPGYVAKKFVVTTDYSVKQNSEIVASILLTGAPPGASTVVNIYVDPEFTVA